MAAYIQPVSTVVGKASPHHRSTSHRNNGFRLGQRLLYQLCMFGSQCDTLVTSLRLHTMLPAAALAGTSRSLLPILKNSMSRFCCLNQARQVSIFCLVPCLCKSYQCIVSLWRLDLAVVDKIGFSYSAITEHCDR